MVPIVIKVFILALVQGFCELLPVSSSAHVIIAEKLMGLDPTTPAMTFLLVMLHTGTMFAVIAYFWSSWRSRYFSSAPAFWQFVRHLVVATACTGVVGLALMKAIEHWELAGASGADVEQLFGNTRLIACALAAVGVLIILSGVRSAAGRRGSRGSGFGALAWRDSLQTGDAVWIGVVQGLCLPFRGFSRSGATISTGLLRGLSQQLLENFSFALAVVLTPAVIAREAWRLLKVRDALPAGAISGSVQLSLVGMVLSFIAGWLALKWLSRWLESGRWQLFGYYCLVAAVVVYVVGGRLAA